MVVCQIAMVVVHATFISLFRMVYPAPNPKFHAFLTTVCGIQKTLNVAASGTYGKVGVHLLYFNNRAPRVPDTLL